MKTRASVIAGIALGAVCAVQAQAADLGGGGSYAVVNNWAGAYAGGTLGVMDVNATVSENIPGWGVYRFQAAALRLGSGFSPVTIGSTAIKSTASRPISLFLPGSITLEPFAPGTVS